MPAKTNWHGAEISLSFKGAGREWSTKQKVEDNRLEGESRHFGLRTGEPRHFSVACDVGPAHLPARDVTIRVLREDTANKPISVTFNPLYNCLYAKALNLKRDWHLRDHPDLRRYDDIPIELENKGKRAGTVPFLLDCWSAMQLHFQRVFPVFGNFGLIVELPDALLEGDFLIFSRIPDRERTENDRTAEKIKNMLRQFHRSLAMIGLQPIVEVYLRKRCGGQSRGKHQA